MTPADAALLRKVQARIRRLQPAIAAALIASLDRLQDLITEREFRAFLNGETTVDALLSDTVIARAFVGYRTAIRSAVQNGVRLTIPDIPVRTGREAPTVTALFNFLDPRVIDGIRGLETAAINTLAEQTKEVVRAYVENGIRDGKNVRDIARGLRSVIGLAPHQEKYVSNLERELRELSPKFRDRVLRDRRYDRTILKAIESGKPLSEKQISDITSAYRRRFAAHNTEVVTRQTTIDAFRVGRRTAWESAVELGYIDGDTLFRVWVHSDVVEQPRPEHVALDGTEVPWDQPYPNGQMEAGLADWGCQCTDRYVVRARRAAVAAPARPTLF